jgi:hypothetical protein
MTTVLTWQSHCNNNVEMFSKYYAQHVLLNLKIDIALTKRTMKHIECIRTLGIFL